MLVKRGSFVTSIRKLASKWGWSKDKVVAFLDVLEEDGMIQRNSSYRRTLITIKNYCIYQKKSKSKPKKPSTDSSTDSSTNRPLAGHSSDADPAHSSNSEVIRSNYKESAAHYDPLAGRRKRYDDL
jgi:DNA-binding transcriptional MocR family regulator